MQAIETLLFVLLVVAVVVILDAILSGLRDDDYKE